MIFCGINLSSVKNTEYYIMSSDLFIIKNGNDTNLNGTNGFVVIGSKSNNYHYGAEFGYVVSSAGDFNGDGFEDMIASTYDSSNVPSYAYILLGQKEFFDSKIYINSTTDFFGYVINIERHIRLYASGISDFNGDGFDDIAISGRFNGNNRLPTYIIYGSNCFPKNFFVRDIDGSNGFKITSTYYFENYPFYNIKSSDFNCDGFKDIILSDPNGGYPNYSGIIYVIYGHNNTNTKDIDVAYLDSYNGTRIIAFSNVHDSSINITKNFGLTLGVGDFNGDNCGDILTSSKDIRTTEPKHENNNFHIIFGSNSYGKHFNISNIDGSNGFNATKRGDSNFATSNFIGDFNNDGFDDVALSSEMLDYQYNNSIYVLYGHDSDHYKNVDLGITKEFLGFSAFGKGPAVSISYGDVNGDHVDDLVISSYGTYLPVKKFGPYYQGSVYVLYGNHEFKNNFYLDGLAGKEGMIITGDPGMKSSNFGISMTARNDLNGDGIKDIVIGACYDYLHYGAAYVVFGGKTIISPSPTPTSNITPSPSSSSTPSPVHSPSSTPKVSPGNPSSTVSASFFPTISSEQTPSSNSTNSPEDDNHKAEKIAASVIGSLFGAGLVISFVYFIRNYDFSANHNYQNFDGQYTSSGVEHNGEFAEL